MAFSSFCLIFHVNLFFICRRQTDGGFPASESKNAKCNSKMRFSYPATNYPSFATTFSIILLTIFDCIFAGIHFSFSGFFCACRKSGLSFLHNILAIVLMRVPGVYVTSKLFPATLLPMGLATAAGSLLSVVICLIAFGVIRRKSTLVLVEE